MKKIVSIYNKYSKEAQSLLDSDKYKCLKGYEGEFNTQKTEEIQKICKDNFTKLIEERNLEYSKDESENKENYVFYVNNAFRNDNQIDFENEHVPYKITYSKKNRQIHIKALSYIIYPREKTCKEDELDTIAEEAIVKFNDKAFMYNKKISYEDKGKLDRITYDYIAKEGIVYDEMKKIQLEVNIIGLISEFRIVDYKGNNETLIQNFNKEDFLSKINPNIKIVKDLVIRTLDDKILYVTYFNYKDTLYEQVVDVDKGEIIQCSRNHIYNYLK